MPKTHAPFTLYDYTIQNHPTLKRSEIEVEFRERSEWLRTQQDNYYQNHLQALCQRIIDPKDTAELKGSANSNGRTLSITPAQDTGYQSYNHAEMFRASIVSKIGGYLQNECLLDLILSLNTPLDELTADEVRKAYKQQYAEVKAPTHQFIIRTLDRLKRVGTAHSVPKGDGVLPLWATDGNYCKLRQEGRNLYLTLKLEVAKGPVTLVFRVPRGERFTRGKVTKPNVFFDKRSGRLGFAFTVQDFVPMPEETPIALGVDLGQVETFVASLVKGEGYSSPYHEGGRALRISQRIRRLWVNNDSLHAKIKRVDEEHEAKRSLLIQEQKRVRSKIVRLKRERANAVALTLTNIARSHGATIVFEDLRWTPNSKWEHAQIQEKTRETALKQGVPVKRVSAKNTSQLCTLCGAKVEHVGGRGTRCTACSKKLGRDVLASRNIAQRHRRNYVLLYHQLFSKVISSVHTRESRLGSLPSSPQERPTFETPTGKTNNTT